MKAICKTNIDQRERFQSLAHFGPVELQIRIDKEYFIMGIVMWQNALMYLVDENGKPDWYPVELFELTDHTIPSFWFFKNFNKDESEDIVFVCGYYELCLEDGHYDKLLERDADALKTYFDRKKELGQ
jgi:hypothetical protein